MQKNNTIPIMNSRLAKLLMVGACLLGVMLGFIGTFIKDDLIMALVGISSAFTFYFGYRNPRLLMSKSWEEFGEEYDNARDKKYLWGFPAYQLLLLAAALYIIL